MPGLFGILDLDPKLNSEEESKIIFTKMADILRHHKEDRLEESHVRGSNLRIGRIGLPGQNPIEWPVCCNQPESDIQIFVSGRLLEYETGKSLRKRTEYIKFQQWLGFFSAVYTQPGQGITILLADRRASIPIYYVQTKNRLLFAPEIKALLASLLVKKEVDLEAFATFLAQGYLHCDQTLFQSVKRLRGGDLLKVENGKVVHETYWRFVPGSTSDRSSRVDLENELGILLKEAIRNHMGEPEKTVIFLSGGVDSRGILGGALACVNGKGERLNTVSWGASRGPNDSDVAVAALITDRLNTNHKFIRRELHHYREHFRRVNYLIDGLSDVAAFHPHEYQIMVELRNAGYKCALSGNEVFGRASSAITNEEAFLLQNMRCLRDVKGLASIIQLAHYDELCKGSDAATERAQLEACGLSPNQIQDFVYFRRRLQTWLQTASYYKQIELDIRNPLLDDSILDFMAKVPDSLRVDKLLYRNVFKREHPTLAQFPYAKRDNLENWSRLLATESPVREFVLEELNDRSSGIWEFINPVALENLLGVLEKGYGVRSVIAHWKELAKRGLDVIAPGFRQYIRGQKRAHRVVHVGAHTVILRSLVLKNWYDLFMQD